MREEVKKVLDSLSTMEGWSVKKDNNGFFKFYTFSKGNISIYKENALYNYSLYVNKDYLGLCNDESQELQKIVNENIANIEKEDQEKLVKSIKL